MNEIFLFLFLLFEYTFTKKALGGKNQLTCISRKIKCRILIMNFIFHFYMLIDQHGSTLISKFSNELK